MIAISPFGFDAERKTQKINAKPKLCVAAAFSRPPESERTNDGAVTFYRVAPITVNQRQENSGSGEPEFPIL